MHRLALRREADKKKPNRRNNQENLTHHRKECDQRIAAKHQKVESGRQYDAGR